MEKLSVIIPVSDQPEDAREVLQSVDAAVDFLRRHPEGQGVGVEVVVVDDSSHPATRPLLEEHARGRPGYQLLLRGEPTNRACARNLARRWRPATSSSSSTATASSSRTTCSIASRSSRITPRSIS